MIYQTSKMPCSHLHNKTVGKINTDYGYEHNLAKAHKICTTKRKTALYVAALAYEYGITKKQAREDLRKMGGNLWGM
ncbi:hypothetical protein KW441_14060 [Vibrio fluvialis]|nr:hypothetical protein [Vibrio fluvialis]